MWRVPLNAVWFGVKTAVAVWTERTAFWEDAPEEEKRGVTVRRRVAPPPAVPEPYVILFESYGSSVQVALVMGTILARYMRFWSRKTTR